MRAGARGLLMLLPLACASGPYAAFDAGHEVHFIVRARPAPEKPFRIHPVCTIGPEVRRLRQIQVGPGQPEGREVAVVRARGGRQRISMWEPRTRSGGRATVDVKRELWVVLDLESHLRVYTAPPHDQIGVWEPLVAVPD